MALYRYDGWVLLNAPTYQSLGGVNVFVCSQPSNIDQANPIATPNPPSPLATIYSDSAGDILANPVVTDGFGHFYFYVAAGTYDLFVSDPYGRLASPQAYLDQSIGVASGGGTLNLETNGTPNTNQNILNIVQGTGISAVADDSGDVTLANTGFVPVAVPANYVYAGPTSGSSALPAPRLLVPADFPGATISANGVITLAGDLGGTAASPSVISTHLASPLPVLQGGTGTATPSLIEGTNIVISGTWPNQNVSFGLASYLVAALPVATEGALAYASNGRKSGEIAGHGTGIPVYWSANGSPPYAGWYNFSGVEVQA